MCFQRFLRMKRILFNGNNKILKEKIKTNKKICVVGVSRKSGVTHLCLALANYLCSVLGLKVIYVELSKESQLLSVVGRKQVLIGDMIGYEYMGVMYILSNDIAKIQKIMMNENAWFVVDMENLNNETQTIFTNCNNRIILGSLSPWCKRESYDFLIQKNILEYDTNRMTFLIRNKTTKEEILFAKNFDIKTKDLPVINDPFSLKENEFEVLMDLI